jgi:small redox-active disulfide protein 2
MEIKILGSGCSSCKTLYVEAERAIARAGQPATLTKVESVEDIVGYGVMRTPALVIDDRVVASGRIPDAAEIVALIRAATATIPGEGEPRCGLTNIRRFV